MDRLKPECCDPWHDYLRWVTSFSHHLKICILLTERPYISLNVSSEALAVHQVNASKWKIFNFCHLSDCWISILGKFVGAKIRHLGKDHEKSDGGILSFHSYFWSIACGLYFIFFVWHNVFLLCSLLLGQLFSPGNFYHCCLIYCNAESFCEMISLPTLLSWLVFLAVFSWFEVRKMEVYWREDEECLPY